MDRYHLGKLVEWAGTLQTRKRLQKVAYLLQAKGAPLGIEFYLHLYGPYSSELANLTDELVRDKLLTEASTENAGGTQFHYSLTPQSRQTLEVFEQTERGATKLKVIEPFKDLAKDLFRRSVQELEYSSTIVYFKKLGDSWEEAFKKACRFKHIGEHEAPAQNALTLAKKLVDSAS